MLKYNIAMLLVILLFLNSAYAISISPGNTIVYFEPNKLEKINFFVTNLDNPEMSVRIFISGPQKDNMNFEEQKFYLKYGEKKEFTFDFNLPGQMNSPGDFTTGIYAQEMPVANLESGTVGATSGVISNIILRVPYEGAYLSAKIRADSVSVGQPLEFKLRFDNLGSIPINNFNGKIVIYNSLNQTVDQLDFVDSLELNSVKETTILWNTKNKLADEYTAKLIINYESKTFETEAKFKLGDLFVEIINYDKEITSGKINEYHSTLRSGWNQKINDVYVVLSINVSGVELNYKDKSFELEPWNEINLTTYIDAIPIPPGKYDASFMVFYDGFSNSEQFKLNVKKSVNVFAIIIAVMLIIIIIITIVLIKLLRKQRSKK